MKYFKIETKKFFFILYELSTTKPKMRLISKFDFQVRIFCEEVRNNEGVTDFLVGLLSGKKLGLKYRSLRNKSLQDFCKH